MEFLDIYQSFFSLEFSSCSAELIQLSKLSMIHLDRPCDECNPCIFYTPIQVRDQPYFLSQLEVFCFVLNDLYQFLATPFGIMKATDGFYDSYFFPLFNPYLLH